MRFPGRGGRAVTGLLAAEFASTLGTEMSGLAIAWAVLTRTGSAAQMGLVMAVEVAPAALVALAGGRLVAALGPRRVALVCEGARAPLLGAIALLLARPDLNLPLLLALVALSGVMISPHLAAQRLLLARIGGEEATAVRRSNAGLQAATRAGTLLGPLIAGSLIAALGPAPVIALDAGSYLLSFALIAACVPSRLGTVTPADVGGGGGACRYLREDVLSRGLLWSSAGSELAFQALAAALPVLALTRYGGNPSAVGLLFACWGLGALLGNLLLAGLGRIGSQLKLAALAATGTALCMWALSTLPALAPAAVLLVALGVSTGVRGPLVMTFCVLRAPRELRAQVTTLFISLLLCSTPVALIVAGPGMELLGVRPVLVVAALVTTVCAARFAFLARAERPRRLGSGAGRSRQRRDDLTPFRLEPRRP